MKTAHLLAAVVALAAIALFAAAASAMYNPSTGTFMQRDPGPDAAGPVRLGTAGPAVVGGFAPRDPTAQYADGMNLYQYVRSNPTDSMDPYGLETSKPKSQCKLSGQPITMTFDARTFSGAGKSWPAASGIPQITIEYIDIPNAQLPWTVIRRTTYTFDYTKERQKKNNEGPVKEGKYWIDACCTNSAENANRHKWWHPAKSSWGDYSWEMHPYPETDMSGENGPRSGFFIHGGSEWGSAGCIDLLSNDKAFHDEIIKKVEFTGDEKCCYIDILVKYAVAQYEIVVDVVTYDRMP